MELEEYLSYLGNSGVVEGGSKLHQMMLQFSQQALRITSQLNMGYHSPEEIRGLMEQLIGKPVDESFTMFPPFYSDFGKNITIGKRVFINNGCLPPNVIAGGMPAKIIRVNEAAQVSGQ